MKHDHCINLSLPDFIPGLPPPSFEYKTRDHYGKQDIDKSGGRQVSGYFP